jgi:hypothetical protein
MLIFFLVNTTYCDEVKDLNDDSGNYLTTVCLVASLATYNKADGKCLSYGMSLYNVDIDETRKALADFSNTRFKPLSGRFLFVHGKISEGCYAIYNGVGLFDAYLENCFSKRFFYCQFIRTPTTVEPGKQKMKNRT